MKCCAISSVCKCYAIISQRRMYMKKEIVTRCGYRCDLCLAYKPNVEKNDERALLSDSWFEIYGFRIPPHDIICEGCISSENPELIDKGCKVRPCVISKNIKNCAYCKNYICETLRVRIVSKKDLETKLNRRFTKEEYEKFIKPYESKERLDKMRESLK